MFTGKGASGSHHWPGLSLAEAEQLAGNAAQKAAARGSKIDDSSTQARVRDELQPSVSAHDIYEVVATGYEFASILARARRPLSPDNPIVEVSEADLRDGLFTTLTSASGDPVAEATIAWHEAAAELHKEAAHMPADDANISRAGTTRAEARSHLRAAIDDRLAATR
jgi:hypothetical protein